MKNLPKKVGIVTTAQHIHLIETISKSLKDSNFEPVVGKGDDRIDSRGQILGCNFTSATLIANNVDSFLFIGSGNFHPLGLMLSTKKPVVVCDFRFGLLNVAGKSPNTLPFQGREDCSYTAKISDGSNGPNPPTSAQPPLTLR